MKEIIRCIGCGKCKDVEWPSECSEMVVKGFGTYYGMTFCNDCIAKMMLEEGIDQ